MYKLIASDMDETFLDGAHRIPAANVDALRRLRELGVLFVPSSGRPYQSIMDNFADVDQSLMEGSYIISYNGGFINRYGDPEPLLATTGDRASIERLYAWGVTHGASSIAKRCTSIPRAARPMCSFSRQKSEST